MTHAAALLRTGSPGKTVTTKVKGLDEEDLRDARVDPAEATASATASAAAKDHPTAGQVPAFGVSCGWTGRPVSPDPLLSNHGVPAKVLAQRDLHRCDWGAKHCAKVCLAKKCNKPDAWMSQNFPSGCTVSQLSDAIRRGLSHAL